MTCEALHLRSALRQRHRKLCAELGIVARQRAVSDHRLALRDFGQPTQQKRGELFSPNAGCGSFAQACREVAPQLITLVHSIEVALGLR